MQTPKSATELGCVSQVVVGVYVTWVAAGFVWLVSAMVVSCQEWLLACLGGLLSLGLLSLENHLSWIPSNVSKIVFLERGMGLHYSFTL